MRTVEITLRTRNGQEAKTTVEISYVDDFMVGKTTAIGGDIRKIEGKYYLKNYGFRFAEIGFSIPESSMKNEICIEIVAGLENGMSAIKELHKNDKEDTCISCGSPVVLGRNGSYVCKCGHSTK